MIYQHCPRCRLAVRTRASYLTLTNCPRCLARARIVSPLFSSPLSARELRLTQPELEPRALRPVRPPGPPGLAIAADEQLDAI